MKESGNCIAAMLLKRMILLAAFCLYSLSSQAQPSSKVCALLSAAEIATTGVKTSANNLVPDGPTPLKKGAIPGLSTDLQMYQCTGEFSKTFAAFYVR
jgi:hypothetical protein